MHSTFDWKTLQHTLGGVFALLFVQIGLAQEANSNPKADIELKILSVRMEAASVDLDKLASDIRAFRRKYPGTSQSVQAAELLSRLPSPLDKLDPKTIKEIEKFDWHPKELVSVLGQHGGRHGAAVSSVAYSPNGKWIVSGGGGLVRTWDQQTMRLISRVHHHVNITSVAFSRDSKKVASAGRGYLRVWDVDDQGKLKLRATMRPTSTNISCVDFSPDSRFVAASCSDNSTHIYDLSGAKPKEQANFSGHTKAVTAVAYSLDGKWMATGSADKTVRLWKMVENSPQELAAFSAHAAPITAIAFSPSSGVLVSGSSDGTAYLWKVPSGTGARPVGAMSVPKTSVNGLTFTPSGKSVTAAYADGSVRFWSVSGRPTEKGRIQTKSPSLSSVSYAPNSTTVVTGGNDWVVRTFDMTARGFPERYEPWSHLSHIYSLDFAPDGERLATGSYDSILRVWDLTKEEPRTIHYLKGDGYPIYRVAYSPDGNAIATGGTGAFIQQWNTATGRPLAKINAKARRVRYLKYTPDSAFLLAGYVNQFVLFEPMAGRSIRLGEASETGFNCMDLSPDGKYVITGSGDYLRENGKIVVKDGKAQYKDCMTRLWNLDNGDMTDEQDVHELPVYRTAFYPGTGRAVTVSQDDTIKEWAVKENKLESLPDTKWDFQSRPGLRFSPDGKKMLQHHGDGVLSLWDVASKKKLTQWNMREAIGSVDFSNDSRYVAIGFGTGVVHILKIADLPKK